MKKKLRTIKKYSNRRLYDTRESRYITLDELAACIREGDDVQVVDAKSGDDLTQQTLVQIVLESRGAARLLPIPVLNHMIRMEDNALAEFMSAYMLYALELYENARRGWRGLSEMNPLLMTMRALAPGRSDWFSIGGKAPEGMPQPPVPNVAPPQEEVDEDDSSDVDELRQELADLKDMIRAMAKEKQAE